MQPAAPGHVAQAARGRRVWGKTGPQRPALLALRDGKAPCLAAPGHVTQAAADREMAKWPQTKSAGAGGPLSRSGMCAAWARQLAARRTREKRTLSGPRSWFLGMGKRLVWLRRSHVAQAAADREMTKMAANEKRGRRRGPVSQQDVRGLGAAACRPNSCQ